MKDKITIAIRPYGLEILRNGEIFEFMAFNESVNPVYEISEWYEETKAPNS